MTLALYGGSFNPPHLGHAAVARHAARTLKPDLLLWMPSGNPPHKELPDGSPDAETRLILSRLAARDLPGVTVSDLEIRSGLRYTADTVKRLRQDYRPSVFWLILGGDMFLSLSGWREPESLLGLCRMAVYARAERQRGEVWARAELLRAGHGAQVAVMEHPCLDISSTRLRELLSAGEGARYLDPSVWAHIKQEGLYGFPPTSSRP